MTAPRSSRARRPAASRQGLFEHTALFEFSKVITSSTDLEFILSHILLTIMGKILSPRGLVLLDDTPGQGVIRMTKGFPASLAGRAVAIDRFPSTLSDVGDLPPETGSWVRELRDLGVRLVLPLASAEGTIGLLCFADRLSSAPLTEREQTYLLSLSNISATAIERSRRMEELQVVNRRLDRKIQELNTLFELGKEFVVILDPDKVVRLLVFSLLGQIGVSRYLIALKRGPDMTVVASRLDAPHPQGELLRALTSLTFPTLVADLEHRAGDLTADRIQALAMKVVVPMTLQGEVKGLILLGDKLNREPYTREDLELLASLGNLAIISLENARLFNEAIEKQKMEDELQIAREIQKGLLPSVLPSIPSMDMAAANISSRQVGGDYYDVIASGDGRQVIAIGDVSGKGTPASLLMANLQATIRALVPLRLPLSELTARVNDLVCQNTGSDKFITFFWGEIDPARRTLTYVNAGHNYPCLLRADGRLERLERGGMILGVVSGLPPYEQETVCLQTGDVLLLFTDGVSEAMSKTGEEYGEERLERLLRAQRDRSAQEIAAAIHHDILDFARGTAQSDDITMMVVKVF